MARYRATARFVSLILGFCRIILLRSLICWLPASRSELWCGSSLKGDEFGMGASTANLGLHIRKIYVQCTIIKFFLQINSETNSVNLIQQFKSYSLKLLFVPIFIREAPFPPVLSHALTSFVEPQLNIKFPNLSGINYDHLEFYPRERLLAS